MTHSGNSVCGFYESPEIPELSEAEERLYRLYELVLKAKCAAKYVLSKLEAPGENIFLLRSWKELFELWEFKYYVFLRILEYYESEMLSEYGTEWRFNANFEGVVDVL